MTDCPFCGQPGREVMRGHQYRCDPCETLWSPVPKAVPERPTGLKWVDPITQGYTFVPFIDHGDQNVRTP